MFLRRWYANTAGHTLSLIHIYKPAATALTAENICGEIFKANTALDNSEVPETGRIIVVTPDIYLLMKQSKDCLLYTSDPTDIIQDATAIADNGN